MHIDSINRMIENMTNLRMLNITVEDKTHNGNMPGVKKDARYRLNTAEVMSVIMAAMAS